MPGKKLDRGSAPAERKAVYLEAYGIPDNPKAKKAEAPAEDEATSPGYGETPPVRKIPDPPEDIGPEVQAERERIVAPVSEAPRTPRREAKKLTLTINKVKMVLPCVEVQITAEAIGCLLFEGIECEFPHTDEAVLEFEGKTYKVMYAGQRIQFEEVPWHVMIFVRDPGPDAG